MRRPTSASTVGTRRPSATNRRGDTLHEDALRAMLSDNPNDVRAFEALAQILKRRTGDAVPDLDPLTASVEDDHEAVDLAVWSLAEELSGHPRAWYPLVQLARLSLHDDQEGALRRLVTAAERDATGEALAEGLVVLREAEMSSPALNLGVGHWRTREHVPETGRQIVLAALDADRPGEALQYLEALAGHPDRATVAAIETELRPLIEARQASQSAGPADGHNASI